jgi:hypothetical protein
MSLTEVLPDVRSLSRLDKIRLIQFLAQELEREDECLILPGRTYPLPSPEQAYSAAAALLKALEEDQAKP